MMRYHAPVLRRVRPSAVIWILAAAVCPITAAACQGSETKSPISAPSGAASSAAIESPSAVASPMKPNASASASDSSALANELDKMEMTMLGSCGGCSTAASAKPTTTTTTTTTSAPVSSGTDISPKPKVALAAAVGAAAIPDVDSTLARQRWRFMACYNKVLASDPGVKGTAIVGMTVDKDGAVTNSTTHGDADKKLLECIAKGVRAIKFSPPTKGAPITFTVNAVFTPK